MLDERKRKILQAIVEDYIATAEPVGSRTLSKNHGLGISAATIRNEMSDLESLGYLDQPHTSAGRIPSSKGYRFYVDQLLPQYKLTERELSFIENWYEKKVFRLEEAFQETVKLVSKMTRNVAILVDQQSPSFRYVQFLPFEEGRVILVLVADNGLVENRMMNIPKGISFDELQRIAQLMNHKLAGQRVSSLPAQVMREIQSSVIQDPHLFQQSIQELQRIFQPEAEKRFYLGGASQLMGQPEFRENLAQVEELLGLLEEERELSDLLTQETNAGIQVTIGQENRSSSIQNCSIVQGTYQLGGQIVGRIAIIGPTRMEYQRVVSVMEYMQRHMEEMLKKYIHQ